MRTFCVGALLILALGIGGQAYAGACTPLPAGSMCKCSGEGPGYRILFTASRAGQSVAATVETAGTPWATASGSAGTGKSIRASVEGVPGTTAVALFGSDGSTPACGPHEMIPSTLVQDLDDCSDCQ